MAIKLIANYSKRLGLPGYSSHQFSVSVETELVTTDDVPAEAARIYHLLQSNVDEQIQATGFVPPADYGMEPEAPRTESGKVTSLADHWRCSDKQKELILKLVDEHHLDRNEVDHLARQRFGKGVKQLNKVEASGLIDELIENTGNRPQSNGQGRGGRNAYKGRNGRASA
ncbi:MAG TPA: hypothetical protein V6D20_05470 [Candidatus Obscuribacterales bacterium]